MKEKVSIESFFTSIEYKATATSTNSLLMQQNFVNHAAVYTFNQTAGRGRLDRNWVTIPNKNLALSIGLRSLSCSPVWITAALAVAAINTLEKNGLTGAWIKWPNDIFVGQCKLAGILTESTWKNNKIDKCVAGIGINLNSTTDELKTSIPDKTATSFFIQTGKEINPEHFTNSLLENIVDCLRLPEDENISQIKQLWLAKTKLIGEKAEISEIYKGSSTISGIIENIDDDGFLYLNDGVKTSKIVTGDVRIIF